MCCMRIARLPPVLIEETMLILQATMLVACKVYLCQQRRGLTQLYTMSGTKYATSAVQPCCLCAKSMTATMLTAAHGNLPYAFLLAALLCGMQVKLQQTTLASKGLSHAYSAVATTTSEMALLDKHGGTCV